MDSYVYLITALLPLVAAMTIWQRNPYQALVMRGILGAVAAMVYTVLGAADVALTEALVGTLLAITLYAVAVRSSMVLRLGVLQDEVLETENKPEQQIDALETSHFNQLVNNLRSIFRQYHMRVELVSYPNSEGLHQALLDKEVHATCWQPQPTEQDSPPLYQTTTRLPRLYEIMQTELISSTSHLNYINTSHSKEEHP